MTPNEFWNCTYKEAKLYVDSNSLQRENEYKKQIILFEKFGNKLINGLSYRKPKNHNIITEDFKKLFEKELEPQAQSVEEQIEAMRSWN